MKEAASKIDASGKDLAKAHKDAKEARDSRDALKRDKEAAESQLQDYGAIKSKMQEVVQDKIDFKVKLEDQRERAEMLATENAGLKDRINEVEEEARQMRKQGKQLTSQLGQVKDM